MHKKQPEMTKARNLDHFHSHLRNEAIQIVRNINTGNERALEDVLNIFRRNYVTLQSQVAAKHKWPEFFADTNTKSLFDFPGKLNECAEREIGLPAQRRNSLFIRKFTPTSQTINKLSLLRKRHIRSISSTSRTRTRTDCVGNR